MYVVLRSRIKRIAIMWMLLEPSVWGFPGGVVVKNLLTNAGNSRGADLIPGSGRSLGEGNGNTLQYSRLGNLMDRAAWQATVHGVAKSQTQL